MLPQQVDFSTEDSSKPPFISFGIGILGKPVLSVPPELVLPRRRAAILVLVLCSASWGLNGVASKYGLSWLGPGQFLSLRFALAAALLLSLARWKGSNITMPVLVRSAPVGVLLGLSVYCALAGIRHIEVARAAFLANLFVLVVPLLAWAFGAGRPRRSEWCGLALCLGGLYILAGGSLTGMNAGDFWSLGSALCVALHTVAVDKWTRGVDVVAGSAVQFVAAALTGILLSCFDVSQSFSGSLAAPIFALLFSAIFPAALALTLQNKFQKRLTASEAGLIYALDPLWCAVGAALLLGERLPGSAWTGCLLLFAGVLLPSLATFQHVKSCSADQSGS